jgi:hypothetical protein
MLDSAAVQECARRYLKTPFRQRGRELGKGIDCIGVVLCVAEELGILDKNGKPFRADDYPHYANQPFGDELQQECIKRLIVKVNGNPTNPLVIKPGDVLSMRMPPEKSFRRLFVQDKRETPITHLAIVTSINGMLGVIHSYNSEGVKRRVVEHRIDRQWMRRIAGVFAFPGVTE